MMGAGGGARQEGFGHLLQSYINAVTKPNASTFEAEIPNASWPKVLIGIAAVAVVGLIMAFIAAGAAAATVDQLSSQFGDQFDTEAYGSLLAASTNPVWSLIQPFITFFLGAGLLWLMAKMFGGQNSDFMTHSYLLSLSYTPTRVVAGLVSIIPCIGALVGLVLGLYQIYLAGLAMQASQRMEAGRAQMAAWIGAAVILLLVCVCALVAVSLFAATLAAMFGTVETSTP
jgi:hypothetical protein